MAESVGRRIVREWWGDKLDRNHADLVDAIDTALSAQAAEVERLKASRIEAVETIRQQRSQIAIEQQEMSDLRARLERMEGAAFPVFEYVNSIGVPQRPGDMICLSYKILDGEYHEYKSVTLDQLRALAAAITPEEKKP